MTQEEFIAKWASYIPPSRADEFIEDVSVVCADEATEWVREQGEIDT